MIKMSQNIEKILEDILLNHGEAMMECVKANCISIFGDKISISEECIQRLIELIEEEKQIALEEVEKEELKMLMQYQEQEIKEWFARMKGLNLTPAEIERMSLFDILRGGSGGGESSGIFGHLKIDILEDDSIFRIKK